MSERRDSRQVAVKNGAGTAPSPRLVDRTAFYGDELSPPLSPPLLAHFLERTLLFALEAKVLPVSYRQIGSVTNRLIMLARCRQHAKQLRGLPAHKRNSVVMPCWLRRSA